MSALVRKIRLALAREGELTLLERLRKGRTFVTASLTGRRNLDACSRLGARPRTVGRPLVHNAGRIEIGDDFLVDSAFTPASFAAEPGGVLTIGDRVICSFGASIRATRRVALGDEAWIAWYSVIHDRLDGQPPEAARPISIGRRVWLAGRVTVLPGASIGDGSIVGAGSVVEGEIPPGVVAAGIPARVLRPVAGSDERIRAEGLAETPPPTHGLVAELSLPIARAAWRMAAALAQGGRSRDLRAALRLRGVDRLGAGVEVAGRLFVSNLGRIEVGEGVVFAGRSEAVHLSTGRGASLILGRRVRIGPGSGLTAHARVDVGDEVEFGSRCMVIDTDFHGLEDRNLRPKPRPIVVGRGVRLGAGTIVLKGVTIGEGAVVEAGSVVRSSVPPGVRVGGVPAVAR
jgi:acetyltransferase-like isoleucine patch superfamily enzyme